MATSTVKTDRIYQFETADFIPTENELKTLFDSIDTFGTIIAQSVSSTIPRFVILYCKSSNSYGAGFMAGWYGSKWYKILNNGGTITLTSI